VAPALELLSALPMPLGAPLLCALLAGWTLSGVQDPPSPVSSSTSGAAAEAAGPVSPAVTSRALLVPTAAIDDQRLVVALEPGPFFQGLGISVAGVVEAQVRATLLGLTVADVMAADADIKVNVLRRRALRVALRAGYFFSSQEPVVHAPNAGIVATWCFDDRCASSMSVGDGVYKTSWQPDSGPTSFLLHAPNAALVLTRQPGEHWAVQLLGEVNRLPLSFHDRDAWLAAGGARVGYRRAYGELGVIIYFPERDGAQQRRVPYAQLGYRF
jgi:hypothetical protein